MAKTARRPPLKATWSGSKVALWAFVGIAALVVLHPAFWYCGAPAISSVVGPVPVLSTIACWLQAGGALAAIGYYLVNRDDLLPRTRRRLTPVLVVWGGLAVLAVPDDLTDTPSLHPDW